MEMPEVEKFFGTFPPKYGTYLISLFGLASGLTGLAGIILYGLIENAVTTYILGRDVKMDDAVRKATLMAIGLTSLLMTVANTLLFLGATAKSRGALETGVYIIFGMCLVLLFAAMIAPLSCFFIKSACIVKKISTFTLVFAVLVITVFLELWLYFMLVANTYLMQI